MVVAGGTEQHEHVAAVVAVLEPGGEPQMWMSPSHPETPDAPAFDMSITVGENTAREMGLTRRDVDEWAAYSHGQAIASIDSGCVRGGDRAGRVHSTARASARTFSVDEHPRRGVTVESLAELKPIHPELENPTVTAGNASGINDAAAALVLTSDDFAEAHGLRPLGADRVVGERRASSPPAPAWARRSRSRRRSQRAGLTVDDIDLFEINEAFCSVPVATIRTLGLDPTIVNVNGSGCSLGHPIAATGARMVVTMVHELRRRGKTHGLLAMCAGGGMGSALVIEVALIMSVDIDLARPAPARRRRVRRASGAAPRSRPRRPAPTSRWWVAARTS